MSVSKVLKTILTFVHTLALYRLAVSHFPVKGKASLCFRVAMLLKTQFTFHRMRRMQRLRKKKPIPNFISLSLYLNVNIRLPNSPNHHDCTSFLSS